MTFFYSVMTVAGTAAKAELPLAILYPKYVEPQAGGSYLDLRCWRTSPRATAGAPAT